jgi:hypothetical protein
VASVTGVDKVVAALRDREQNARRGVGRTVLVTYGGPTAPYAMIVHERRDVHHPVGQAGYLLDPSRQYAPDIARTVREAMQKGRTLLEALFEGGQFLLNVSLPLVPIEFGNLRASGQVRQQ